MAHQYLSQLDAMSPTLRSSVFGNAATLIAFRLGGDDARAIHTLLDDWPPETLTDLDNHTAIIRPLLYGQTISPFILKTHEVPPGITFGKNNERHILNFSRMKYGKPRYQVEGEITRWMEGSGTRAAETPSNGWRKQSREHLRRERIAGSVFRVWKIPTTSTTENSASLLL